MLWIQAHDGTLIHLGQVQEISYANGTLYAVGVSGRHKLAAVADGADIGAVVADIKTALGSGFSTLRSLPVIVPW